MIHQKGTKKRRFLVIARVGDESLHRQWLYPNTFRNFDLYLSYYGSDSGRYKNDCEYYSETKGPRWPVYKEIVEQLGERLREYDAVWFPADDISTDAYNINLMFHIFDQLKLWLAQPALTKDSFKSWNITIQSLDHIVRYTHFVEIMAPLFSPAALQICCPSFDANYSGWGIDFVWPKLLNYPDNKIAMIDATPVRHTRPVGKGNLVQNQSAESADPSRKEQFKSVLEQHQISFQSQYPNGIKAISGIKFCLS
ncbi:MAG TPA: DUF707 domain-containing protein [Paenibacillus sp.]|uniref:DUF707 domain-containing protein n=1 Tax=Paenibacillus sp. TaxID=58172 RepID=UPI002C2771A9|nr:DUF707 domain-containing protein [Paenibacillus sp.]HUC90526.1 DUF707 domain-containing protein [Paenibacillus sp.]